MERTFNIPEIMFAAGTRVALGLGIGLLIAGNFNNDQRKGAGWTLAAIGALTTIPLAAGLIGRRSETRKDMLSAA